MKTRFAAVALAALGLIAWVDPKTAAPVVSKEAAADEALRQMVYVYKARAKEAQRVDDIAFRIMAANQDLCADRKPTLGMEWSAAEAFGAKFRAAAVEAFQLGEGLTVVEVVSGGPAATAGLRPGDAIVSFNGEPAPSGKGASDKLAKRLREVVGQSTASVTLVVRRAGEERSIAVTPVMACDYGVVVADQPEINAFADGRNIYVTRPMLRLAASEEELALVIAHEVAHNGQRHIQAKRQNARVLGLPGLLIDVVAAANGVDTGGAFTKAGMQVGMAHAATAFETEADYVGMYYMARAGYSTEGVEDFWRKMAAEEPNAIFIKSSHPTTADRFLGISATAKEVDEKRRQGQPLTPNQKTKAGAAAQ